jgi:hypothetical protein
VTRFAPGPRRRSSGGSTRRLALVALVALSTTLAAPNVAYGADQAPATSPREEVGPTEPPPRLVLTAPSMAFASDRDRDHETRARYLEDRRGFLSILLAHGTASLALGATMLAGSRDPFAQGFGLQTLAWGAVNDTIALVGLATETSVARSLRTSEDVAAERRSMRRFLWVNVGLDALYVTCGALLAGLGKERFLQGNGAAVLSQGAFLFVFDLSGSFWQGP